MRLPSFFFIIYKIRNADRKSFLGFLSSVAVVSIVTSLTVLLSTFSLSFIMAPKHFGQFSFFSSILAICLNVLPFGTLMSIVVDMNKKSQQAYSAMVTTGAFITIPVFAVISLLASVILSSFSDAPLQELIAVICLGTGCSLCLLYVTYLRASQQIRLYAKYFVLYTLLLSLSYLVFYVLIRDVFWMYVCTGLVVSLLAFFYLYLLDARVKYVSLKGNVHSSLSEAIQYGFPVVLSSLAMSFLLVGDKVVLGTLVPAEVLAGYSAAALLSSTTLFLVNNFASAWGVHLSKNLPSESFDSVRARFGVSQRRVKFVIGFGLVLTMLHASLYIVLYEDRYPGGVGIVVLLTMGYVALGISKFYIGYMNFYGKNLVVFYASLFGIAVAGAYLAFAFDAAVLSMAIAVFLGLSSQLLICWLFTSKKLLGSACC